MVGKDTIDSKIDQPFHLIHFVFAPERIRDTATFTAPLSILLGSSMYS